MCINTPVRLVEIVENTSKWFLWGFFLKQIGSGESGRFG